MSNYSRKAKRNTEEKEKAPRCCGRHMFMNKYGLWQCRKCGGQKFNTGSAPQENVSVVSEVTENPTDTSTEIIDVEAKEIQNE